MIALAADIRPRVCAQIENADRCPLSPHKRRKSGHFLTAALCQKATKCEGAKSELFDHLISERKQHWWYLNSKRLGGLEVDHQLELDRHLNGKLARLLAAQDTVRIGGGAPIVIAQVISVG